MIKVLSSQGGESGKGAAWGARLATIRTMGGTSTTELTLLRYEDWAAIRLICGDGQTVTLEGGAGELYHALKSAISDLLFQVPSAEAYQPPPPAKPLEAQPTQSVITYDARTGEVVARSELPTLAPPGPEIDEPGPSTEPAPALATPPEKLKRGRRKVRGVEPGTPTEIELGDRQVPPVEEGDEAYR